MEASSYTIVNNEKDLQFETDHAGEKAYLSYRYYKKDIAFTHVVVPATLEGQGVAGALTKAAFAFAADLKKPVMIYCPYVSSFIQKHPEYKKQLDPLYYK